MKNRIKAAYDRGAADSYYRRVRAPNIRLSDVETGLSGYTRELTTEERTAYFRGYDENEEAGAKKEWN